MLVLTLKRKHDFYIDDSRVVVKYIRLDEEAGLQVGGDPIVKITSDDWTEIFPGAFVRAAWSQSTNAVRVIVNAPGMDVVPGTLYRRNNQPVGE